MLVTLFQRKKTDQLNSYHLNIAFTVEKKSRSLPRHCHTQHRKQLHFQVYTKPCKVPTNWDSEVPASWKHNAITGTPYCVERIATNFEIEVKIIKKKFQKNG